MKSMVPREFPEPYARQSLVPVLRAEGARTDRLLQTLGDDLVGYRVGSLRTIGELVVHCASVYDFVATALHLDIWDASLFDARTPPASMRAAIEALEAARAAVAEAVEKVSDQRWCSAVSKFGFTDSVGSWPRRAFEHEVHHRGEICVYAAMSGNPIQDMYSCVRNQGAFANLGISRARPQSSP